MSVIHPNTQRMSELVVSVAEDICSKIEQLTGDSFCDDKWERKDHDGNPGGGGNTRIAKKGRVIESGAVNTSTIHGTINPDFAKQLKGDSSQLEATGVSLIFHPRNPHVPTVHMNFRYIRQADTEWFGGGADLTPYLPNEPVFKQFHCFWKQLLDRYNSSYYPEMKEECDKYFSLPHRQEMRGIGGIFYDYLEVNDLHWEMVDTLATNFINCYLGILKENMNKSYTEEDRTFQLYRRGRYVEFNLIYDRGTIFGLKTNGRVESILASLPPEVRYEYMYNPESGSIYEEMAQYYQPYNWVEAY